MFHILDKPINPHDDPLHADDMLSVVSAHRKRYTTFWMDIFPKIVNSYKRPPQTKSNTITHFVGPAVYYKEIEINEFTTKLPKINDQTSASEGLFTISNESVEFPSFYDSKQVRVIKVLCGN